MIPYQWFLEALERIAHHIRITPTTYDPSLDSYLKWENQQITGSFKIRGAFNKILCLESWEQKAGLLAASAGNHGQGVALAGKYIGAPVTIFTSENTPPIKVSAMRDLGADVILIPGSYGDAEQAALEQASKGSETWISPYNDGHIIAGQGTIALETHAQVENLRQNHLEKAAWVVPTSGGGLLAGIAAALSEISPDFSVYGVQTDTSPFMHGLFHCGSQDEITELPTIADGLAGPVEEGSITIPIVQQYVDDILLVTEKETLDAIVYAWEHYGQIIEGAAAVSLAAVLSGKIKGSPKIIFFSGGNIQESIFNAIIRKGIS